MAARRAVAGGRHRPSLGLRRVLDVLWDRTALPRACCRRSTSRSLDRSAACGGARPAGTGRGKGAGSGCGVGRGGGEGRSSRAVVDTGGRPGRRAWPARPGRAQPAAGSFGADGRLAMPSPGRRAPGCSGRGPWRRGRRRDGRRRPHGPSVPGIAVAVCRSAPSTRGSCSNRGGRRRHEPVGPRGPAAPSGMAAGGDRTILAGAAPRRAARPRVGPIEPAARRW